MKILKRMFVCVLALLCVLSMSVGCKRPETIEGSDYAFSITPDKDTKATLRVGCQASNDEKKIILQLGESFKKYYPNVTVEVQPISGNIVGTMMGFFRAENMPDIFQTSSFEMLSLGGAGAILSLDPYIEAEIEAGSFNKSDYYEQFFTLGQENFNGKQWMIPRAADQVVCHYNAKKLKEAGVDLDPATTKVKNGWTWQDFLDVCDTVRASDAWKNSDRALLDGYLNWEAVYNPIILSCGGGYYDENNNVIIDSEGTRKALNLMKELVDKKIAAKFTGTQANFSGGEGVFMFHSQAASIQKRNLAVADDNFKDEDYNVVTFPIIDENAPKVGAGVSGYCVASTITDQTQRDIAWQFLKFMLSREGQNVIADCGTNYPPLRKDMADFTDSENNHWGKGFENYNMSAFTWAGANNAICPTDFVLAHAERADDLQKVIVKLIGDYIDTGKTLDKAIATAKQQLEYWLTH